MVTHPHVDSAAKARINGAGNRAFNILSVLLLSLAKMDIGEMGSPHKRRSSEVSLPVLCATVTTGRGQSSGVLPR